MNFIKGHRSQASSASSDISAILSDPASELNTNNSGALKDFDCVMVSLRKRIAQIPDHYKQDPQYFNPLEHVIEMTKSPNFEALKKELEYNVLILGKVTHFIVKAQFDGFNKSIKNYSLILDSVNNTDSKTTDLSKSIDKCSLLFNSRSHSIKSIFMQTLELGYVIEILDKVKLIKKVPERYRTAFSSGQYVQAANILVEAFNMLYQDELLKIGALVELQDEIVSRKNDFYYVLIECLHNLLYLKDRNLPYSKYQLPSLIHGHGKVAAPNMMSSGVGEKMEFLHVDENEEIKRLDQMNEIVLAFFALNKQRESISTILDRLRSEIRDLVQKTVILVTNEYEKSGQPLQGLTDQSDFFLAIDPEHQKPFEIMLEIVLEKCLKILNYHRFLIRIFTENSYIPKEGKDHVTETHIDFQSKNVQQIPTVGVNSGSACYPLNNICSYHLEHVWDQFQIELQLLIAYLIDEDPALDSDKDFNNLKLDNLSTSLNTLYPTENQKKYSQNQRLFSFCNSSTFTFYEINQDQDFKYNQINLCKPSIYNLVSIYPLITYFVENGANFVDTNPAQRLKSWLDHVISSNLLVNVRNHYKTRVEKMFISNIKSKGSTSTYNIRQQKLQKVMCIYQSISELFNGLVAMPKYASSFHEVMILCLSTLHEFSKDEFNKIVNGTEAAKAVENREIFYYIALSSNLDNNSDLYYIRNIKQNILTKGCGVVNNVKFNSKLASNSLGCSTLSDSININASNEIVGPSDYVPMTLDENNNIGLETWLSLEQAWCSGTTCAGVSLSTKHMIFEPNKLASLSSMHYSLCWIIDKVSSVDKQLPATVKTKPQKTFDNNNKFGASEAIVTPANSVTNSPININSISGRITGNDITDEIGRFNLSDFSKKMTGSNHASFLRQIKSILSPTISKLQTLADQCLQVIYIELRVQTCYFLDGIGTSYSFPKDDHQPDPQVVALNESLLSCFTAVSLFFSGDQIKYIFSSIPKLISDILIESLKLKIETLNTNGILKMARNIFALEKNLTSIVSFDQESFNRVRKYYELLNLSPQELYQFIEEHSNDSSTAFTLNNYRTILEITSGKSRVITDEQERELRHRFSL